MYQSGVTCLFLEALLALRVLVLNVTLGISQGCESTCSIVFYIVYTFGYLLHCCPISSRETWSLKRLIYLPEVKDWCSGARIQIQISLSGEHPFFARWAHPFFAPWAGALSIPVDLGSLEHCLPLQQNDWPQLLDQRLHSRFAWRYLKWKFTLLIWWVYILENSLWKIVTLFSVSACLVASYKFWNVVFSFSIKNIL